MSNEHVEYLPQLKNSVPPEAVGYTLSMYSVALEGWRRGLTLTFINNNNQKKALIRYKLSDGKNEHLFQVSRGDKVSKEAIKICVNKHLTKEYLKKANVPVAEGDQFTEKSTDDEIIKFANKLGYPLVLKPTDGTGGHGVIANIKNEKEFKEALNYVKGQLGYKKLIVEKHFEGEDYRLHVVNEEVIGAIKKERSHVVGDGIHTIQELIDLKNRERTKTPALRNRPITTDQETIKLLKSNGQTLESIPEAGEIVYLKSKNNVSSGGDPIDITDELTDEIKEIAINATKAIPGLVQSGVDLMVNMKENTGIVLEVNSRPHITAHLYPMKGKARDIPKAVIDYYFPNTNQNLSTPSYYFDLKSVWNSFLNGFCKEYTIPDIPQGDLEAIRFKITGVWGSEIYKKWVREHARKLKLHGYIKHLKDGETSIVVSGKSESIKTFREIINNDSPSKLTVAKVTEETWKKPVKIGFEIKKDAKLTSNKKGNVLANNHKLKIERDYYKKKYRDTINSTSWKVSAPIRFLGKIFKRN